MRQVVVLAVAWGVVGTAWADDKADSVQGAWAITSVTRDGKDDPALKGGTRVHEGPRYVVDPPAGSKTPRADGTFTLDTSKTPWAYDMKPAAGRYKDKTLLGIVKVENGTMTICFAEPGGERPSGFESGPNSGRVLAVHAKAK